MGVLMIVGFVADLCTIAAFLLPLAGRIRLVLERHRRMRVAPSDDAGGMPPEKEEAAGPVEEG